jgi:hypothetical protein
MIHQLSLDQYKNFRPTIHDQKGLNGEKYGISDWYVIEPIITRDTPEHSLEKANWESMLALLEKVDPDFLHHQTHSFGHYLFGHYELILISDQAPEAIVETVRHIVDTLEDQPYLDEELFSKMEAEGIEQDWEEYGKRDFFEELKSALRECDYPLSSWLIDWFADSDFIDDELKVAADVDEVSYGEGTSFQYDLESKLLKDRNFCTVLGRKIKQLKKDNWSEYVRQTLSGLHFEATYTEIQNDIPNPLRLKTGTEKPLEVIEEFLTNVILDREAIVYLNKQQLQVKITKNVNGLSYYQKKSWSKEWSPLIREIAKELIEKEGSLV